MSLVIVTSNKYDGEYDFNDVTNAYYIVLTPEPFEARWNAFKVACREHFVTYHIVFITPLVEKPSYVGSFLFQYGKMLGYPEEDLRMYDK